MKLKEICTKTGLSRKTIRLYEEKGLLVPQKEYRNGREYRDYTEADVRTLKEIATLRRAWFTMEEIRRMQVSPESIQEILPQYHQWLTAQKAQLEGLLQLIENIEPESVASVGELSRRMSPEARKLPLPAADIKPRFKQLDALDDPPRPQNLQEVGFQLGGTDFVYSWPYITGAQKWVNETENAIQADADLPVQDREPEPEPRWLRFLQVPIIAAAFVSFGIASVAALCLKFIWQAWLVLAISGGLWALIAYRRHCKERDAWIRRMGWDQQENADKGL